MLKQKQQGSKYEAVLLQKRCFMENSLGERQQKAAVPLCQPCYQGRVVISAFLVLPLSQMKEYLRY